MSNGHGECNIVCTAFVARAICPCGCLSPMNVRERRWDCQIVGDEKHGQYFSSFWGSFSTTRPNEDVIPCKRRGIGIHHNPASVYLYKSGVQDIVFLPPCVNVFSGWKVVVNRTTSTGACSTTNWYEILPSCAWTKRRLGSACWSVKWKPPNLMGWPAASWYTGSVLCTHSSQPYNGDFAIFAPDEKLRRYDNGLCGIALAVYELLRHLLSALWPCPTGASSRSVLWPDRLVPARLAHWQAWHAKSIPHGLQWPSGWTLEWTPTRGTANIRCGAVKFITGCDNRGGKQAAREGWDVCIQLQLRSWGHLEKACSAWNSCKLELTSCCIAHFARESANSFQECPWWRRTSTICALMASHLPWALHTWARMELDRHVVTDSATVQNSSKTDQDEYKKNMALASVRPSSVQWLGQKGHWRCYQL